MCKAALIAPKGPAKLALMRAVASSTAFETGQSISELKKKLKMPPSTALPISNWQLEQERLHVVDQSLQFSVVVYEHLVPP